MLINFLNKIIDLYSTRENKQPQSAQYITVHGRDDTDNEHRISKWIPSQKIDSFCRHTNKPFKKNIDEIMNNDNDENDKKYDNKNNKLVTPGDVVIFSGVVIIMYKLIHYYRN